MITREQLKKDAKQSIKGKIGMLFVVSIIIVAIVMVVEMIPIIGGIATTFVFAPAFALSLVMIYLKVAKGEDFKIGEVFDGFYNFWGAFKVTFLVGLFTFLWSLLFIVPGIIAAYSYYMAMFIYAENKDMGALEAIRRSKEMMKGHKMDAFVLELSFIGWMLLTMITFGIAYIYVLPYMETSIAKFYLAIKPQEQEAIQAEFTEDTSAPEQN